MTKYASLTPLVLSGTLLASLPTWGAPAIPTSPASATTTTRSNTSTTRAGSTSTPTPAPASTPAPTTPPSVAITNVKIAAEVGGENIEMADVNRLMDGLVRENPKLADNSPESKLQVKQLRDDILENMISQRLLLQEAERRKLTPAKEKVDEAVWDFQKSFDSPTSFNKWLTDENKTTDDLRDLLSRRIATEALKKALIANVAVTDLDLKNFYDENKDEFFIPETVAVRDIHIAIPKDASEADKKKLKQRAQDILKKALDSNTDFAALAKANSDDKPSAERGGDMGMLTRDDIVDPNYSQAIFGAPVGKVNPKIVETKLVYSQNYNKVTGLLEDGTAEAPAFHIIKIEDKKPSRTLTLAEVTEDIKPYVLQEKAKNLIDQTIKDLRAKAAVKKFI